MFLFFASGAVLAPAIGALFGKLATCVAFGVASARFAVAGVYEYHGGLTWEHASGWVGVAACAVALYAAIAFEIEDTRRHSVLPVLRKHSGPGPQ
jgi:uncharacterized protein